jgi:hypothetical protein
MDGVLAYLGNTRHPTETAGFARGFLRDTVESGLVMVALHFEGLCLECISLRIRSKAHWATNRRWKQSEPS